MWWVIVIGLLLCWTILAMLADFCQGISDYFDAKAEGQTVEEFQYKRKLLEEQAKAEAQKKWSDKYDKERLARCRKRIEWAEQLETKTGKSLYWEVKDKCDQ